jgi:ribosomal protein S18 acetylase RimI-like enzyme
MKRPIEPGDFEAVARLIERVNEQPATRDLHTWETPAPALARQMRDRDGSFAGYLAATIQEDDTGHIDYLATAPARRGRGIATGLLAEAMRWLFEQHRVATAHLTVRDDKSTARHLYECAGFRLHVSGIPADLTIR